MRIALILAALRLKMFYVYVFYYWYSSPKNFMNLFRTKLESSRHISIIVLIFYYAVNKRKNFK